MKTLHKALLILILIAGAVYYFAPTQPLSLTGTPVNIQFGDIPETNPYETIGKYYIADFVVSGDSANLVFVPEGLKYTTDRLELKLEGHTSVLKAPLVTPPTPLKYRQVNWIANLPGFETLPVKYREVSMSKPFIHTYSLIYLSTPDDGVKQSSVIHSGIVDNVESTVERIVVNHDGVDRTIYIRFDNLVFNSGDLTPAGSYAVFEDHLGNEMLVEQRHLSDGTGAVGECYADDWDDWNCFAKNTFARAWLTLDLDAFATIDGYDDYSNWMYENDKLPDVCAQITNDCDYQNNELSVYYPTSSFTQAVTVYVPEELAEFIMLVEKTPEFEFYPIEDVAETPEGQVIRVNIKGIAKQSGTISLMMQGTGMESVKWLVSTQQTIEAGKEYTFPAEVKLSQVDSTTKLPITVHSRASNNLGVPTSVTFHVTIGDTSTVDNHDLTVRCVDSNDNVVTGAEIYVDNVFSGYGSITKNVVQGNHAVYSKNVTGWYAGYLDTSPKTIAVNSDMTIDIPFTTDPPKPEPFEYMNLLIIGAFGIIAVILLSMIGKELGYDITPTHTLVLIILIVVLVVGYIVGTIGLEALDRLLTAIEEFKLLS